MNKQQYAEYESRVEKYLNGIEHISTGPCPGEEYSEEPWFSWSPCEVCGSSLGGNRESWHGVVDGSIIHGTCCEDCAYYLNYGRLDDTTMMEIETKGRDTMKPISEFEVVDHGIDYEQYFPGCGLSCTEYTDIATGIGDTPEEAIDDALEQLAMNDWDTEGMEGRIEESSDAGMSRERVTAEDEDCHYYLSIRVK